MMTSAKQIARHIKTATVLLLLGLTASCSTSEIVIPAKVDIQAIESLPSSTSLKDFANLPAPTTIIAQRGMNLNSQSRQPDGITDWIQYENHNLGFPTNANRWVTIDLLLFAQLDDAQEYMSFESANRWYKPRLDKFSTGTLSNGIDYCASYIQQARSCPAGLNLPMDAFHSFLIVRAGSTLAIMDVYEINTRHPRGITQTEVACLSMLLRRQ